MTEKKKEPKAARKKADVQQDAAPVEAAARPSESVLRARLRDHYDAVIRADLKKEFGYANDLAVPRLDKIVINMGVGEAANDKGKMTSAVAELQAISGQKPVVTKARKSIAQFKVRENSPVGCKVTLRGKRMYEFLDRLITIVEGTDRTHRWIIDPLDGTTNFLHGIPIFAISVALERDGQLIAGVIYNPILNELYVAENGQGAFLNDRRLRVAARRLLPDAVVATGAPNVAGDAQARRRFTAEFGDLMGRTAAVRRCGAAAVDLAWVASGRFDGFWERGLKPWDMAAGILIVREAGGRVSGTGGKDDMLATGNIIAGNEAIHGLLLTTLGAIPAA